MISRDSDDHVEIRSNQSSLNDDRSRRNALILLVPVFPPAKTASGRRSLYDSSAETRSRPGCGSLGKLAKPAANAMQSMAISPPFSISWRDGRRKNVPSRGLARRYGCRISGRPITTSRLRQLSAAPPIQVGSTSERDPSGRGCCGTRWSTSQAPSPWPRSFDARAGSTRVRRDLRVAAGDTR